MKISRNIPSKSQIFDYWKDRLTELDLFIDWGEPSCWACSFHYGDRFAIKRPDTNWEDIFRCWDRIPLQRCHIIPRSLGGTDDVSNLFLMCRECHDLAPNTNSTEIFFKWAKHQSWYLRAGEKIFAAFDSFDVSIKDREILAQLIGSKEFKSWVPKKIGLHRPQSNYPTFLSRLTPSTIIGLALQFRNSE